MMTKLYRHDGNLCCVILSEGAVGGAGRAEVEGPLYWQARSIPYRGPSTPQSSAFADDLVAQDDRRMKQVADKQSKSPPRDDDATRAYKPLQTKKNHTLDTRMPTPHGSNSN